MCGRCMGDCWETYSILGRRIILIKLTCPTTEKGSLSQERVFMPIYLTREPIFMDWKSGMCLNTSIPRYLIELHHWRGKATCWDVQAKVSRGNTCNLDQIIWSPENFPNFSIKNNTRSKDLPGWARYRISSAYRPIRSSNDSLQRPSKLGSVQMLRAQPIPHREEGRVGTLVGFPHSGGKPLTTTHLYWSWLWGRDTA